MKKTFLSLVVVLLMTGQVQASNVSESVPKIHFPTNGDCFVSIFRSELGRNKDQNFLNAIQEKLEEGYVAKSGIKVSKTYTDGSQSIYIDLYKENCGGFPLSYWLNWLLLPVGVTIIAMLFFKFRGSFKSRVHSS